MAKEGPEAWPRWPPASENPLSLVDIRIKLNVDKVFQLLYVPGSEYVAHSHEVRGNKDYMETPWVSDMKDLAEAELAPPPPHGKAAQMDAKSVEGKARKTSCSSFGMGLKFKTEEVQRCIKASKGKFYEVEVCVATTATYGDKFRGVCRHRLQADGPDWCTWKAEFALVYIQQVNGLLKKAIEKGSASGLAKNFATLVEIMGSYGEVQIPQKGPLEEGRAQPAQAGALPASDALLGGLLNAEFVRTLEPLAASMGLPVGRGKLLSGSILATGMAVAVLLLVLEGILDSGNWVLRLFNTSPVQISAPANILTVIMSLALFKLAQVAFVYAAAAIGQGASLVRGYYPSAQGPTTTPAGEGDSEIPTAGTRFDGFNAALDNASADIATAENDLRQAYNAAASIILSPHSGARAQLRSGVRGFQNFVSNTWSAGCRAVTNGATGALSPERTVSPPPARPSPGSALGLDSGDEGGGGSDDTNPGDRFTRKASRRRGMRSRSPTKDAGGDSAAQARAVELSALGPKALSFTSQTSSQQAAEERGVVEAEVFENERFLPFRGWGHEWPGHLLPTDRVGHWSLRGDRPNGAESMDFHRVAPGLPQGWQWLDEDWHIDMTGHEDACVDNEGWYYAVDFNWLKHPPAPGSGRFKRVRDYVRRRRWVRTRVRDDNVALAGTALRQLGSMSSMPPPLLPLAELLGDTAEVPLSKERVGEPGEERREGSFSLRGSGDHSQASRRGSNNLDLTSGRLPSASCMPTPRLMYSTSRGISLQESGVELSDRLIRLKLFVSEGSDRPVRVSVSAQRSPALPDSTVRQAVQALAPAGDSATTSLAGNEEQAQVQVPGLPKPAVASTHAATEKQASEPAAGAMQASAFAGAAATAASAQDADTDEGLRPEKDTAFRSEAAEMPDHGSRAQQSPEAEAHRAAATIAASLQSSSQPSEPASSSIPADASLSADGKAAVPDVAQAAGSVQETTAGGLPPVAQLVEQQVHASLEPSTSNDRSAPAASSSLATSALGPSTGQEGHVHSFTSAAPEPASSAAAGAQPLQETEASMLPAVMTEKGGIVPAASHSDAQDSVVRRPSPKTIDQAPVNTAAKASFDSSPHAEASFTAKAERQSLTGTPLYSSRPGTAPAEHTDSQPGSSEKLAIQRSTSAAEGPILGLIKPALKGLTVPKPTAGGSRSASTAVSPSAITSTSPAAADQAAASEQEALSPSTLSDSSEFGGRLQQGHSRDGHSHTGHVDWNELGKRSSRLAALAGEGLRKGLRDMQHHATRQTAGKREADGQGGLDSGREISHADSDQAPKRSETPQREHASSTFLQSLKARGEQSLNAARSALSPESGRPHEGHGDKGPLSARDGQPGIGPSVRGMFSDLKRTMERVGASPLIQSASTLGRRESSSSLREHQDHAMPDAGADKHLQQHSPHADTAAQPASEAVHAVEEEQSLEEQCKSISDAPSRRSSDRGDGASHGTPEVLSADEWGDFDFEHDHA